MNKSQKSVLGKFWFPRILNEDFVLQIVRNLRISDVLARILSSRVDSVESALSFLDPKLKSLLPDPFHLKDMQKAVERVILAINKKEKICIFGDYDVDGATSSALLKNFFKDLGVQASIYIPDRIEEGYGPNPEAMQKIRQQGVSLVITVDCGSVSFEAIKYANSVGLEVIVIDHHISMDSLPEAVAIINPNRLDEISPCKNLAAVGVSFLFIIALVKILRDSKFFAANNIDIPDLMKHLDLVALGTVCDVMQLTGLNRAFVSQGLKVARQRANIGYKALWDIAGINEALNCYHLGFVLGPRINAGGRVGKSDLGARLLSTDCSIEATNISHELDKYNQERKAIELLMQEEAENLAIIQAAEPMIFVASSGWHPGVIGIVAGRLKEKYNKPVAVIALSDGLGKASCRSVRGIDFGNKILKAKQQELLLAGGGHAMAAGFTVEESKIQALKDFLCTEFAKDQSGSDSHMHEYYELDLTTKAANVEFVEEINKLAPFGHGNSEPVFKFSNLYVLKADIMASKHIKILFACGSNALGSKTTLPAVAFNAVGTALGDIIMSARSYQLSALGKLKINVWQNRQTVQLQLQDLLIE